MTIYHENILKYMRAKGRKSHGLLFKKSDEKDIIEWPDPAAWLIWIMICNNIFIKDCYDVGRELCPYCIRHRKLDDSRGCGACTWGANHGYCGDENSDVHKVSNADEFTSDFYKKLIKRIEGAK